MVANVRRLVARVPKQGAEVARKRVRIDAFTLDQPGIAERRFVAGLLAVDQCDLAAAFLKMHRHRHADNACAEHDGIEFHGGHCRGSIV
jgi:hypothetical protein